MKNGKLLFKAAAACALTAALGAVAALVAVKAMFPEPKVRAWVVDSARRQLGRDVRLDRIGLGPRGLSLHGLEVSEKPDFSAGSFLRVETFRLRPSWKALLRRRLVVAAVTADGLTVRVLKGADGHFNYETLASSAAPSAPAASPPAGRPGAPGLELDVKRIFITDGTIAYADAVSGSSWTLNDVDLDVANFSQALPFGLTASFRAVGQTGTRPVDARVAVDLEPDLARGSRRGFKVEVKRLVVEQQGLTLSATGRVARLDAPEAAFDAALSYDGLTALKAAGTIRFGDAAAVDAKFATPGLRAAWLAGFAPGVLPAVDIPAAELALNGTFSGDRAEVKSFVATWAGGKIEGAGEAQGLASAAPSYAGRAAFGADLPAFRLSDLSFPIPGLTPSFMIPAGRFDGAVRLTGDDVRLDKVSYRAKGAAVTVDGVVAKALSGDATPDLAVSADLDLPSLTDKDVPFHGAPAGLRIPPSHWTADGEYSARLLRVKSLRVRTGRNDIEVSGIVTDPGGRRAYDLVFKGRSFGLEELTSLTPQTRDEKLAGSGFFALTMAGSGGKPAYAGKVQFKGVGATLAGLPLSGFDGTVTFDSARIDAPNLTGKVADGLLKMDLTVKDYATAPEVQLEASLDRFDLGRYLEAKRKIVAAHDAAVLAKIKGVAAAVASGKSVTPAVAEKPRPTSTRGHFVVGTLIHPDATLTDVKVSWDLRGLTPDLRGLNGEAQLQTGGGQLHLGQDKKEESTFEKALFLPLLPIRLLIPVPDWKDFAPSQIVGDYGFQNGTMTLRQSRMESDKLDMTAKGTIDLPAQALNLTATVQLHAVPIPIEASVTGTFDNPKPKINVAKTAAQTAVQLIHGITGH